MPLLLQVAGLHGDVQPKLAAKYQLIEKKLGEVDAAWMQAHGQEVEGVVTGGGIGLPNAVLDGLPKLKVVAINGVGFDKIELEHAKARGVRVSNTPDVLTEDVADLAVGLTLALLRRLPHAHAHVQGGHWPKGEMKLATKLSGKRVGIFGLGRIGRAAAKRFGGFTDHIAYTDVAKQDVPFHYYPDAVALAGAVDVFVICAAASGSTRKAIGAEVFRALGPKGVLVNIARGSIVDEAALVEALQAGTIGGAALDVFENEPHVPAALLEMEHVVVTPHVASGTHETRAAMGELVVANLDAFFEGREMPTALV